MRGNSPLNDQQKIFNSQPTRPVMQGVSLFGISDNSIYLENRILQKNEVFKVDTIMKINAEDPL